MKLVLALAAVAPLLAQCSYSVDSTQFNIAAGSANGSVTGPVIGVTTQSGCYWSATTNTSWLHVDFGQTGTGGGTVGWHADTNTFPASRSGTLSVAGQTISVLQAAQVCSYVLTPQTANFPIGGGNGTAQVQTACSWAPSPFQNWIQLTSTGAYTTGNGTLQYTVSANGCVTSRTGAIGIAASVQLPVTQDGSPGNFTFSPASESFSAAVADDRIAITTGNGCGWSLYSDVSWLTVTSASSGLGAGVVTIHVVANTSAARTGNLHINDNSGVMLLLPVTQAAPVPPAPLLNSVENAASYLAGAVSPGEIVSLFGSNLGPASPVSLQVSSDGLSIAKTLAGAQVLFDNVPAALTYASAGQLNAVVPYEVSGNSQTKVQVVYQGTPSNSLTLPVQPSTPAIFTLDSSGAGPGAILNQDLKVNTAANRAARGSVVVIYCTGGGVTSPALADAAVTPAVPPYPALTLPYSVTIGGQNAAVQYAGGAPTVVAGLTQINAVVPAGVSPGASVPVLVSIGNVPSSADVTIAVQ